MKTAEKLEAICETYGITFDADKDSCGDWNILFYAPDMMEWGSSTCSTVSYRSSSLQGVISYIKRELKDGFHDASADTLWDTGQGET
tara:strand:- start:222 stop:482 length:261 start_codon:yes stop_codon:yes gene_type:complete